MGLYLEGLVFGILRYLTFYTQIAKILKIFPLFLEFRDKLGEADKNRESRREKIPGGVILDFLRGGCAARTLKPLVYTRASASEFCYPTLGLNSLNPPPHTHTHTHTQLSQSSCFPETSEVTGRSRDKTKPI